MLVSKLVKTLQEYLEEYGDLPVHIIVENDEHSLQIERIVGSTAVSVRYKENGKDVKIPTKIMIIQEDFD